MSSNEKIFSVLRAPRVSEKTARLQELSNQYVFEVSNEATKADVKAAVEQLFDVKVEAVLSHRDQGGKPYMTPGRVRGMAAFRGAQAKNVNAEAFEPVRLLGSAIGDL